MHILITGGTGFFGRALLRHWLEAGEAELHVTVLAPNAEAFRRSNPTLGEHPNFTFHSGSIESPETLPHGVEFTHIIHAALAPLSAPAAWGGDGFIHNVSGTKNVLDLAARSGAKRFLFTSSGAVYGAMPSGMIAFKEDYRAPLDPLDHRPTYAMAKLAGEHLCALYAERFGLETVVARCFAFAGEDLPTDGHFAIGNFVRDAAGGKPIVVNGDGTAVRSYLDQSDLARWLTVLLARGEAARAYNVGSERALTVAELAETVAGLSETNAGVRVLGIPEPDAVRSRYVPATDRARDELGLSVTVELESSIRKMLEKAA
jgi:dTDP-glucose 4,6-dehydratase